MHCATCKYWTPDTISKIIGHATLKERICTKSLDMSFPAYGQDGRPLIVHANFGCILYEERVEKIDVVKKED